LDFGQEVYAATASFGQGITTTVLQMASAYAALANGGILMQPMIVDEIRRDDGTVEVRKPKEIRRVLETKTARLIGAMLVSVVEYGHGKRAGVPGYYIGGKTGTAQIARTDGLGYQLDATIGSFAGFGPVNNPKFAMVVRIDHPRDVQWAESTAAPLFGEIAKFLLQYFEVPPERPI
jgi:cell division protein FtsI/penicillin-binding protein 2